MRYHLIEASEESDVIEILRAEIMSETLLENIRAMMETLHLTAEDVINILDIPAEKQEELTTLIKVFEIREQLIAGCMTEGYSKPWATIYAKGYEKYHLEQPCSPWFLRILAKIYAQSYFKETLENIIALMKNMNLTAEAAMNALKLSPEEQKELAPLIMEKFLEAEK